MNNFQVDHTLVESAQSFSVMFHLSLAETEVDILFVQGREIRGNFAIVKNRQWNKKLTENTL